MADTIAFNVDFTGPTVDGMAVLATTVTVVSPGVYGINDITGTFSDSNADVSGDIVDIGSTTDMYSPDGSWTYDDLVYMLPDQQYLDIRGLLFAVGDAEVNIWGNGEGNEYTVGISRADGAKFYGTVDVEITQVTAEPSSLSLSFLGAIGMVGLFRRRKIHQGSQ
jgi:hypothetical protein